MKIPSEPDRSQQQNYAATLHGQDEDEYRNTYFLSSFAAMRSAYPEGVSRKRPGEGSISGKGASGTVFL